MMPRSSPNQRPPREYYHPFTHRFVFYLTSGRVEVTWGDFVKISDTAYLISSSEGEVLHEYSRREVVRWSRVES